MPDQSPGRFKAFISYSHKDALWATWLQKGLETYRVDRALVGTENHTGRIPPNLRPIFVDRDDFAGGSSLKDATLRAITGSQFLIVICSPNAAVSTHVNDEILLFIKSGGSSRIIPIIIGGEPRHPELECFPTALRFEVDATGRITDVPAEPLAADAREIADGREIAKLKVVAGLLGIGLDEIRQRAVRAARRRFIALAVTAGVMGALAIAAGTEAWIAHLRKQEAEQRLDWALQTAGAVTSKVATFRGRFGVPAPVLTDLLQEVERLLGRLSDQGVQSSTLTMQEASLLGELANSNVSIGNTQKALLNAKFSEEKRNYLANTYGPNEQYDNDLIQSRMQVGDILLQQNKTQDALAEYSAAKTSLEKLLQSGAQNAEWQSAYASLLGKLSSLYLRNNLQTAKSMLDQAVVIRRMLLKSVPDNDAYAMDLAKTLSSRAMLGSQSGAVEDAKTMFMESDQIQSRLSERDPNNTGWAEALALTEQNAGYSFERLGDLTNALTYYQKAESTRERLSSVDPTNVSRLAALANIRGLIANVFSLSGKTDDARRLFAGALDIRRKIVALDPLDASEKGRLALTLIQLAKVQYDLGDGVSALHNAQESSDLAGDLLKADPHNDVLKTDKALALGVISVILDMRGDDAKATSALEEMATLSKELAVGDPTSAAKAGSSLTASVMLAGRLLRQGKPRESLDVLGALQAMMDAHFNTTDTFWLTALVSFYGQKFRSSIDTDAPAALESAEKLWEICERWTKIDPNNLAALRSLSMADTQVGIADRMLNRLPEARAAISAGLDIRNDLVRRDKSNALSIVDLAASWSQLDAVLWLMADYAGTLDAAQHALTLRESAVALGVNTIDLQADIATSYSDIALAYEKLDNRSAAREALTSALKTRCELASSHPDRSDLAANATETQARLAAFDRASAQP